jgi:ketosteroid isomerase-like protein
MSQENVELARRGYEAFATGDLAPLSNFFDPEIEVHDFPDVPDRAVYHGPEGFLALVANVVAEFDDFRIEPEKFIALTWLRGYCRARARPAARPEKMQPPRKVPSSAL